MGCTAMRHVSGWEIAALIVCVILFIGCQPAAEPSGTDATNTTPDPVAQNESVQEEDKPTTIVIDVRSKEE